MEIWYKMLGVNLLIALLMLISGKLFSARAPGKINTLFGYRTTMSMKNRDTWEFAHKFMGKQLWSWGWGCVAVVVAAMSLLRGRSEGLVQKVGIGLCIAMVAVYIVLAVRTENALKEVFHEDGSRRESHE